MKIIPYSKQFISKKDKLEVNKVLSSDFITSGPKVELFEKKVKTFSNAKYAVAVNSATSALHIACMSLGLKSNDLLWTVPNSFVASANCGLYCGAKIDFVDIDNDTLNISINQLEQKLISSHKRKKLPKILVVVHFAGASCEMDRIKKLSNKYKFRIIEDASHAIGGDFNNYKVGSCKYSDITVFSFHPVKIITSGEGGMATTNDENLAATMRDFRSHGITKDSKKFLTDTFGPWYYEQQTLGFNYRMTDLHASLGLNQLDRIDTFIEKRHSLAKRYNTLLAGLPITLPFQLIDTYSAFHLYIIWIDFQQLSLSQAEAFKFLMDRNIGVNLHYIPVYKHPYYHKLGFHDNYCEEAERYYSGAISIPIFSSLSHEDQDTVIFVLKEMLQSK